MSHTSYPAHDDATISRLPGFWPSPLGAEVLAEQSSKVSDPQIIGDRSFWLESRPSEQGRVVLMCAMDGTITEVLPKDQSVRTRAQEYGGGAYLATPIGIFFVSDNDQRIYFSGFGSETLIPVTPEAAYRYADFCFDAKREQLLAIREDLTDNAHQPRASIIAIDLKDGSIHERIAGADFYSNPRLSPNGEELAFVSWNHPDMPWQASGVWLATLDTKGSVLHIKHISGGPHDGENSQAVSVFAPSFSPKGDLFLVDDRSNWWNIYRHNGRDLECVVSMAAEFATPQWVFGMSTYGFLSTHQLLTTYTQQGRWSLGLIDVISGELHPIHTPFCDIHSVRCDSGNAIFIAGSPHSPSAVYEWREGKLSALSKAQPPLAPAFISRGRAVKFPTQDGEWAHGFFYPPAHRERALNGKLPPLLVMAHGGPTGATETLLNPKIQYWTTRGFAVLDVNYRGSTGYGRRYRDRLLGNWGVTDVIDVCSGAKFLADQGLVDPSKMVIRGSSAGGFTVLASLTFSDTFKAGASLYGIGDLTALAKDTHKFEAHYLDGLIAPYPAGEAIYHARSPLMHVDKLTRPVIFFQGLDDKVVPPAQAQQMVDALREKGITAEYVTFAGEGHGFRKAENIIEAFNAELAFYQTQFLNDLRAMDA